MKEIEYDLILEMYLTGVSTSWNVCNCKVLYWATALSTQVSRSSVSDSYQLVLHAYTYFLLVSQRKMSEKVSIKNVLG